MKSIERKKYLDFPLLVCAIALQLSCGGAGSPPIPGGNCSYSKYSGSAEVTELKAGQNGYWMYFKATFVGAQPPIGFYNPNSDSVFVNNPSGETTPEWLTSKSIVVGAKFEMNLSLINTGACTPVIHEFPTLPNIAH